MNKDYWKKILIRAWHAVWETASATLPATIVITPEMIKHFDINILIAVAAWMGTALIAGAVSIVKSLAIGIPEAEKEDEIDYLEDPANYVEIKEVFYEPLPGEMLHAVLTYPKEDTTASGITRQEAAETEKKEEEA